MGFYGISEACRRSQDFLSTTAPEGPGEDQIRDELKKQLLLVARFRAEEIEAMNLPGMGDDEVQETIRKKLFSAMEKNGARQKVVPAKDVKRHIEQGGSTWGLA